MINQPRKTVSCCISASSLLCIAYIFIEVRHKQKIVSSIAYFYAVYCTVRIREKFLFGDTR